MKISNTMKCIFRLYDLYINRLNDFTSKVKYGIIEIYKKYIGV